MDKVELYCSEVDINQMQLMNVEDAFMMPEGESLRILLGDKKYRKLNMIAQKAFNINLDFYDRLQPIVTINQLSVNVLSKDFPLPLDVALWSVAAERALELGGLETVEDQKKIMQSLDIDRQLKMLKDILRNVSKFRDHTLRLVDLFVSGDLHRLYMISKKELGKMRKALIYDRNDHMVEAFMNLHGSKPVMAAVGAGHFAGSQGLISKLRKKGASLRPAG